MFARQGASAEHLGGFVSWSRYVSALAEWDRNHPTASIAERDAFVRELTQRLGL